MSAVPSPNNDPSKPWIDAGVPVFPCSVTDKKPLVSWRPGKNPLSVVDCAWAWRSLRDAAVPGLDCQANGMFVVDIDKHHAGANGAAAFKSLCKAHGIDIPDDFVAVQTAGNGAHLYFADPEGRWRNTAGALARGIDTRGVGGYVIAPGAVRADGKAYTPLKPVTTPEIIALIAGKKLPVPPKALADLLDEKCSGTARRTHPPASAVAGASGASAPSNVIPLKASANRELMEGAEGWTLEAALERVAAAVEGERNNTFARESFTAGLRAKDLGLDIQATIAALIEAAKKAGSDDAKSVDTITRGVVDGAAKAAKTAEEEAKAKKAEEEAEAKTGAGGGKSAIRVTTAALRKVGVTARRDTFKDVILISGDRDGRMPAEFVGPLTDAATHWLASELRSHFKGAITAASVHDVLVGWAEHNRFNSVAGWLDGLKWDGRKRLSRFLPRSTGAKKNKLNARFGAALAVGMCARARWPGTKFDTTGVLEGPQGGGKSSWAAELCEGPGSGYFCDTPGLMAMDSKTRGEQLSGKWVVELGELAGMRRKEAEETKAFMSLTADRYRPAYGRTTVEQPRTCIFIGTTNSEEYLQDKSGNRRFLPIPCGKLDLAWLRKNRDQIFAEADQLAQKIAGGAPQGRPLPREAARKLELPPKLWAAAAEIAEDRREVGPLEIMLPGIVEALVAGGDFETDIHGRRYILAGVLVVKIHQALATFSIGGLGTLMQDLGWERGRLGKKRTRIYYEPKDVFAATAAAAAAATSAAAARRAAKVASATPNTGPKTP